MDYIIKELSAKSEDGFAPAPSSNPNSPQYVPQTEDMIPQPEGPRQPHKKMSSITSAKLSAKGHAHQHSTDSFTIAAPKVAMDLNSQDLAEFQNAIDFSDPGEELKVSTGFLSAVRSASRKFSRMGTARREPTVGIKVIHPTVKRTDPDFWVDMSNSQQRAAALNVEPALATTKSDSDIRRKEDNYWVGMKAPQQAPNANNSQQGSGSILHPTLGNGSPVIMPKKAQFILMGGATNFKASSLSNLIISQPTPISSTNVNFAKKDENPGQTESAGRKILSPQAVDPYFASILPDHIDIPTSPVVSKLEPNLSATEAENLQNNQSKFSRRNHTEVKKKVQLYRNISTNLHHHPLIIYRKLV